MDRKILFFSDNKIFEGNSSLLVCKAVAYPGIFSGGGVQQIQFKTEDRENGDLGALAP